MALLAMDTTFGPNRFRMKHWPMCGKNEKYRTLVFAKALIMQETTEQFTWLLNNRIILELKIILRNTDPEIDLTIQSLSQSFFKIFFFFYIEKKISLL